MTHREVTERLAAEADGLEFGEPVAYVYNPVRYAMKPYLEYWDRYGAAPKEVVFVGMNPGPWGMAQTGVPFGEVGLVRDWLGIEADVGRPPRENPKRPVEGFACGRSEVSGKRLWGWAAERFGSAETFFSRFFVANYCPLMFMEEGGRNRTPDKLKKDEREALRDVCDRALADYLEILKPGLVVGVGKFAQTQVARIMENKGVRVGVITHPSPANPKANRGWTAIVEEELAELGVAL